MTTTHTKTLKDGRTVDVMALIRLLKDRRSKVLSLSEISGAKRDRRSGFSQSRYDEADTSYPMIVDENNELLDGRHRYFKKQDQGDTEAEATTATPEDIQASLMDTKKEAMTKKPEQSHQYISDDDEFETYASIGVDGLLAASEKLLAVNRGLAEPDNRDSLPNDRIYTVDRLMAERVKLDHGKVLRKMMGRASRTKNLNSIGANSFGDYTTGYITSNPNVPALEEINPMHILEQKRRITKMGPGGIGDPNAITGDMQAVDAQQFGFVDPIAGPESEKAGIDVRLSYGTRIGSDGKIYQLLRNRRTGKKQWVSPTDLQGKTLKLPD